jgi:hypothetical protein
MYILVERNGNLKEIADVELETYGKKKCDWR